MAALTYRTAPIGDEATTEYRVFIERVSPSGEGTPVSPFHDIPLQAAEGVFNMVVEIPRGTSAKLEIATGELMNPIKQDVKKGALRVVADVEPYSGYIWNYGAFPQTWEDPTFRHPDTNANGDRDPLDVCEIGSAQASVGQVKQVKVLGIIAMIDDDETDWKVLAIDITDPLAPLLNDLDDVLRLKPGLTHATYEWLRTYKVAGGGKPNNFAFDGSAKSKSFALQIIQENHEFWKRLIAGKTPAKGVNYDIALANTTLDAAATPFAIATADARALLRQLPHVTRPTTVVVAASETTAATVQTAVQAIQRTHPHGSSELGALLQEIVAGRQPARSPSGLLVASYGIVDKVTTFGVYQKYRGHGLLGGLATQVHAQALEQVAAGYVDGTTAVLTTGYGRLTFLDGAIIHGTGDHDLRARALDKAAKTDDQLLGVTAPLALLLA